MESVPSFLKESRAREESKFTHEKPISSRKKESESASLRSLREKEKRYKIIYEDEGRVYEPADEDTIVDRFKVAVSLRKSAIAEVFKIIRRARNVQLCFLVDVTGSMKPHIDGVRKSIVQIIKNLTDDGPHSKTLSIAQSMEVAFVGYRDIGYDYEVLPFTNAEQLKGFSRGIRTGGGGGDITEDAFGGLDAALNLVWSDECGTKVIFHICDFPGHGNDINSGLRDNYPDGDPKGMTAKWLFSRLREKGIQYYFGKITDYTDIMIKKFSEAYGEPITDFNVKNVDSIMPAVTSAVSSSLKAASAASHRTLTNVKRKERPFKPDKSEPDWTSLKEFEGTFSSYEFPKSIEHIELDVPLERKKPKEARVKIAEKPFAKGAERHAYYGKNLSSYYSKDGSEHKMDEDIVFKENSLLGKGMNSANRYQLSNQMNTIVSYLAQLYTADLKKKAGVDRTIKFIKIRTLAVKIDDSNYRFMTSERRFSADDKFVRYTNNATYIIPESEAVAKGVDVEWARLVIAFSHWTYKASNRFLMVVDLEGVVSNIEKTGQMGVLLTDPAIHCRDETRYGRMNHGTGGMKNFFTHHECNQFCKALGLEGFDC